jgi:thiamine biosynthesis lipoprotein
VKRRLVIPSRRARPTAALAAAGLLAIATLVAAAATPRAVSYAMRTMGTYAQAIVVTDDSAASLPDARAAHAALARVDSLMSNWTTTSEVARLNRLAAGETTLVQPEVARVLEAALRIWRESDGAYDVTVEPLVRLWGFLGGPKRVPAQAEIAAALRQVGGDRIRFDARSRALRFAAPGVRVDLGGIAKGYAVDVASESLAARGVAHALVDLSGNMKALGHPPGASHWRIGVRDPRDRLPYLGTLQLMSGEAISTSGKYEQFVAANGRTYGHILDPRTGWPVEGLLSVTIVATTALEVDGWDTPLFVMGLERARQIASARGDFAAILVAPGVGGPDTVWVERALEPRFALDPRARSMAVVRSF